MNSARILRRGVLLAGVSALALAVASPEGRAADQPRPPMYTKAPVTVDPPWTWWIEGAAFWTGGDSVPFLPFPSPLATFMPRPGWEAAIGFDYRFDPAWHVSADFRYGAAGKKIQPFAGTAAAVPTLGGGIGTFIGAGTATEKEHHWVADFMVGRDIGLGGGKAQVKFGLRIAEIYAKTVGRGVFTSGVITAATSITQRSKFLGLGPRAAIEGSNPLLGPWTFDYGAGIAALFGNSKLDMTDSTGFILVASHKDVTVFNLDASAGLSYWMSPTFKVTAGYRFDGYWNSLRTFGTGGTIVDDDRYYHGPFLRLTGKF